MKTIKLWGVFVALMCFAVVGPLAAQETTVAESEPAEATAEQPEIVLPGSWRLNGLRYEAQHWNNCGPATLTNALSYFGYADNQDRAANFLKPNYEDKNVSPDQMAYFVNNQVPEIPVYALVRTGGTLEMLKTLLFNNFPVIIEAGYDPEPDRLGWMGHYLLVNGYDDALNSIYTYDSYLEPDTLYAYDYIEEFWQHFNYTYIVLYESGREPELLNLLGPDADIRQNTINSFEVARAEVVADQTDKWAWFNMGTNLNELGMYEESADAYDKAFGLGMPFRTLWYQFGPFEAYYQTGEYDKVLTYAQANLNDGGGHFVEETFYYGGLAREALGETDRALNNYLEAARFNPNFTPAIEARDRLQAQINGN